MGKDPFELRARNLEFETRVIIRVHFLIFLEFLLIFGSDKL